MRYRQIVLLIAILSLAVGSSAQEQEEITPQQTEEYTEQSKQIIHFLEGTLNFLGDDTQLPSDKDVIINSSYLKFFKDDKVQIEDDLDENREIQISKDVQAYLKDIDFFFKEVTFTFNIDKVEQLVNEKGEIYFKVTMNRNLKGVTIANDTVDNNLIRYAEINLDPYQKDLKIVSLYTTKLNEKAELKYWWDNMTSSWKKFFGNSVLVFDTLPFHRIVAFDDSSVVVEKWVNHIQVDTFLVQEGDTINFDAASEHLITDQLFTVTDTITMPEPDTLTVDVTPIYDHLMKFREMEHLDVSRNMMLGNLNPVSELTKLKEIDFSNTLIDDLSPLRNLNQLEELNCSGTPVTDLYPLRYASNLKSLYCAHTPIIDFTVLSHLARLEQLDVSYTRVSNVDMLSHLANLKKLKMSGTQITDLSAIGQLTELSYLNLSSSAITSLQSISTLTGLKNLNIDSTQVEDLTPLAELKQLSVLQANHTPVDNLSPLEELAELHIIYCDNSGIDATKAQQFIQTHENCLVIFNSEKLMQWWNDLPEEWKNIVTQNIEISSPITKEEVHQIINQTELKVNVSTVGSLEPLEMLYRLEELNIEDTDVADLSPVSSLKHLRALNLSNTKVTTLEPIRSLDNIRMIVLENTSISDLMPLENCHKLETVYCDKSQVSKENVLTLKKELPECLVVYQSDDLNLWWGRLDDHWQELLREKSGIDERMDRENLQRIADMRNLSITDDLKVKNLEPLTVFLMLEDLSLHNTAVSNIAPITSLPNLKSLAVTSSPINMLDRINLLKQMEHLNIENTSVEDLEPVYELINLKTLNIGGTQVKKLKGLEELTQLESLTINNTRIKNLKPLNSLYKLKELKCFNIDVKASKIEDYKKAHPHVNVIYY